MRTCKISYETVQSIEGRSRTLDSESSVYGATALPRTNIFNYLW